jgi:hypothetical protein
LNSQKFFVVKKLRLWRKQLSEEAEAVKRAKLFERPNSSSEEAKALKKAVRPAGVSEVKKLRLWRRWDRWISWGQWKAAVFQNVH